MAGTPPRRIEGQLIQLSAVMRRSYPQTAATIIITFMIKEFRVAPGCPMPVRIPAPKTRTEANGNQREDKQQKIPQGNLHLFYSLSKEKKN